MSNLNLTQLDVLKLGGSDSLSSVWVRALARSVPWQGTDSETFVG